MKLSVLVLDRSANQNIECNLQCSDWTILEYKYENCMTTRPEDCNQYLQYSDWTILQYKYNKDLRRVQYDTSAACHVDK